MYNYNRKDLATFALPGDRRGPGARDRADLFRPGESSTRVRPDKVIIPENGNDAGAS
jgi:hypothetical protein